MGGTADTLGIDGIKGWEAMFTVSMGVHGGIPKVNGPV